MQWQQMGDHYVARLDEGEEVLWTLRRFLVDRDILAGRFMAWGSLAALRLQYNRPAGGRFEPHTVELAGPLEVASLLGNIATLDDEPVLHAHVTVADASFRTYSGHLASATAGPTVEVVVKTLPRALHRFWNARLNVAVLDPEEAPEEAERLAAWP